MASDTPAAAPLAPAFHVGLRVFAFVVLLLMLAAIGYAGWIVLENWSSIGV